MKKSILIGALVVLLLAGFTACSNNTPSSPIMGKQVEGITLVSAPDYLVGVDTIDAADLKLSVLFNDNSTMNYTGAELNVSVPSSKITANTTSVAVPYGSLNFYVNVPAYNVEDISIDVSGAEQTTIAINAEEISLDGVAATLSYNGGQTRTVDFVQLTGIDKITFDEGTIGSLGDEGDTIDVVEALDDAWTAQQSPLAALIDKITGTWEVTITSATATITSVTLTQTDENEIFYVGTTKNLVSGVALEGTVTYSDGTTKEIILGGKNANATLTDADAAFATKSTTTEYTITLQNVKTTFGFTSATKSITAEAIVTDNTLKVDSKEITFTINTIEDYPTKVTVEANKVDGTGDYAGTKVDRVWDWEDQILASQFTFTVANDAWASENTYSDDDVPAVSQTAWTPDPSKIKIGTGNSENFKVTFTYTGKLGNDPDRVLTCEEEIKVNHVVENPDA